MEQPIRILNIFMVLDCGGAETLVMNLYRHIDRSKIQFDFLVHGEKRGYYEDEIEAMGGKIYRLPSLGLSSLPSYLKAVDRFFDEHPDYRIVHSHASELGCFIFQKAKKHGVPCRICHAHSAPKGLTLKTPVRYLFKKYMLRYTNKYFSCSREAGVWQFGKKTPFRILQNGIPTKRYRFNPAVAAAMREKHGIAADQPVIGHVGRFEAPKNHTFLIDIFEQFVAQNPNAVLFLLGDGSLRPSIEEAVKAKRLDDHVRFEGVQSNVPDYLQMMDVFLFPSLFEGLPVALNEAQAAGLRCVISDGVPAEAAITDAVDILSLKSSAADWANHIGQLSFRYDRSSYADAVKAAGYDIEASVRDLQAYYEQCYKERSEE